MHGQGKGVEGGMVVEVTPRLWSEHLNGSIERGRGGYQQAEQRGIEGIDVAEVDDICLVPMQVLHGIGSDDHDTEGQEDEQVGVGEEVDELGNGVIGRHTLQQFRLAYPSLGNLVVGHLHPHGVYAVGRYGGYFCYDDAFALCDIEGVESHIGQGVGQWE